MYLRKNQTWSCILFLQKQSGKEMNHVDLNGRSHMRGGSSIPGIASLLTGLQHTNTDNVRMAPRPGTGSQRIGRPSEEVTD
jgi:hypothetical protein